MLLDNLRHYYLGPADRRINSARILAGWRQVEFEPTKCVQVIENFLKDKSQDGFADLLNPKEIPEGGYVASDKLLFESPSCEGDWHLRVEGVSNGFRATLEGHSVRQWGEVLRLASRSESVRGFLEASANLAEPGLLDLIATARGPEVNSSGTWVNPLEPGIYRREHACLVIRSDSTTIMVDPTRLAHGWTTGGGRSPADPLGAVDAVLITHQHGDHFHLPTLLRYSDPSSFVLVPQVKVQNLLTRFSFQKMLDQVGQPSTILEWGKKIQVGDITIEALPFYGEQPTRSNPIREGLRNWGNCYRVETPRFSVAIMADSGVDPMGSGVEVLRDTADRDGPVDVLLSCCAKFPEVINPGLPDYFLAVPFEVVARKYEERRHGRSEHMTFGPEGVAAACEALRPRYVLPYAHGFSGLGKQPVSAEAADGIEDLLMNEIRAQLAAHDVRTEALTWRPGSWLGVKANHGMQLYP